MLQDTNQVSQVCLFWHLEEDLSCEEFGVTEDITEFRPHEFIWVLGGIGVGLYAAPGGTDDEGIGAEGLYLQEVLIDVLEDVG